MDQQPTKPRKSMHAQIVQDLGMHIVSGRFKPEERLLMEATLCEEYKVSRSVLREATRVLSAKGLVISKPKVGAVVRPRVQWHLLDPDVLTWLMQSTPHSEFFNTLAGVRRILEPEIAAMAATTATDADIATIEKAYLGMETANTHETLLQADLDFHQAIADATRNDLLAYMCICCRCHFASPSTSPTVAPTSRASACPGTKRSSPRSRTVTPSARGMPPWCNWTIPGWRWTP